MCPPCAWLRIARWLLHQKARLLACEPYHVIFTLPHELTALWLANVAVMTTLLFASLRDTLLELLGDAASRGATPGSMATWHTWSQPLILPPPLQALVTGGGLTRTGQGVAVRHGCLLPSRVAMAVFRGKLLAAIRRAVRQGQVQLPAGLRPQPCENLRHPLGRQQGHVYIRERYPHGEGVRISLARYGRGGPLANQRLGSCAQGEVRFRYRVNGAGAARPRGGGRLPRAAGPGVCGSTVAAGLADGVQPAGCGASGTLSCGWSTAGLLRQDSTPAAIPRGARARGGRGMSHQHGVGPGRRRVGSALTPRQSWAGNTPGSDGGLERTLSSPPSRLLEALSSGRRVPLRGLNSYKAPRTSVPHSVRG